MLRFSNLLVDFQLVHFLLVAVVQVFVKEVFPHLGFSSFLERNSSKVVICYMVAASFLL